MSKLLIGYFVGLFLGIIIMCHKTWGWPTDNQIGMTFIEVKEAKERCEKSLPRDKQCKIIVKFVEVN